MMERLTKGQVIKMTSGKECRVLKELGEGGQGYIYKVRYEGKDMALKWYKMDKIADKGKFYRNLQNNIKKGAPTKAFVWPVELTVPIDGGFGYLMDLIPDGYAEFKHYLLADVHFSGIKALINAALGLIDGFEKLHNAGFSYQDLNDGNFSIHPETGDVLICDNDNVSEYGDNSGIAGKCRYMAPEVVRHEAKPSIHTDRFSLAVVLYKMLFVEHPLEGKRTVSKYPCMREDYEVECYGIHPIFTWDPMDSCNRPVRGVHTNAIKLWPYYPEFVHKAFADAFSQARLVGTDIRHRMTEQEWREVFVALRDCLARCSCGDETFIDPDAAECICMNCGKKLSRPYFLHLKKSKVVLVPGKKLYACHTMEDNADCFTITADVVRNPQNPSIWGLHNISGRSWRVMLPNGTERIIENGRSMQIGREICINFGGTCEGTIF